MRADGRAPFLPWREDIATMLYGLQTTYAPSTNGIKECRRFECSRAGVRNAVIFVSVSGSNIVLIRYSYSHRIFDLRLSTIFALGRVPKEPGSLQLRRRHKRPCGMCMDMLRPAGGDATTCAFASPTARRCCRAAGACGASIVLVLVRRLCRVVDEALLPDRAMRVQHNRRRGVA